MVCVVAERLHRDADEDLEYLLATVTGVQKVLELSLFDPSAAVDDCGGKHAERLEVAVRQRATGAQRVEGVLCQAFPLQPCRVCRDPVLAPFRDTCSREHDLRLD